MEYTARFEDKLSNLPERNLSLFFFVAIEEF